MNKLLMVSSTRLLGTSQLMGSAFAPGAWSVPAFLHTS
jgi:hypothetical protein